jgi:hypothetical protein
MKYALGSLLILVAIVLGGMWITSAEIEAGTYPFVLSPENWPETVDETVKDILPRISRLQKLELMFMKKSDTYRLHFELGLGIRNRYGLWRGNEKLILSACGSPCHPDEASGKIIDALWDTLHK